MIDYDFEERLVDRIAVNEAIAARLNPRQRRVLLRYHRYGETLEEVGRREGVTRERIRSVLGKSYHRLRAPFIEQPKLSATKPEQTTRNTPPPGFDKAAFLRHMRWLIAKREEQAREQRARDEERARNWRKREREALDRIMRNEEQDGLFDPPPPPPPSWPSTPSLRIRLPVQYTAHPGTQHYVHNSLSYAPPPSEGELSHIAHDALEYLLLTRPHAPLGNPFLGKWCTSVIFPVEGGITTVAVDKINAKIPHHARLSAYQLEIPKGTVGANPKTPYASLRATLTADGRQIRFDVTWD